MGGLFPILLAIHIALAVALLLPSVVVPFLLRPSANGGSSEPSGLARFLVRAQGTGSVVISIGLGLTGAAMLAILGPRLLRQPWLITAIGLYIVNLVVAALISRPGLRSLVGLREGDPQRWRRRARRQRQLAYLMAGAIGVIALLMSTKPQLW